MILILYLHLFLVQLWQITENQHIFHYCGCNTNTLQTKYRKEKKDSYAQDVMQFGVEKFK